MVGVGLLLGTIGILGCVGGADEDALDAVDDSEAISSTAQAVDACYYVSSVSPVYPEYVQKLNQMATFTVKGQCLPTTLAFWVDQCANVQKVAGGTSTQVQFTCMPSWNTGLKNGKVKPYSGAPELGTYVFTIKVVL
jgi:hypothetical protein